MNTVTLEDIAENLDEFARRVEAGETVTVVRDGKPVLDLVPRRQPKGGLNLDTIDAFKKKHGIDTLIEYVAEDFDAPLPEDFLITPLPPLSK